MRKLEQDGVISGYHARLNAMAPGQELMAFVTVSLNAAVKPVKQILEFHTAGGGFDCLLKIRMRDMGEYRDILGGVIGTLPMVESTHSYFVTEEIKESPLLPVPKIKDRRS